MVALRFAGPFSFKIVGYFIRRKPMESKNTYSKTFVVISGLYIACLLISNIIAGKLWQVLDGLFLPAAVILFPLTYIIGDILTEVYGFQRAKTIIWLGFVCSFFAVAIYFITIIMPSPEFFENEDAYKIVLGTTPRVAAASLAGYLFGEFSNSVILSKLKVKTNGKKLWLRTFLSTVIGEGFDTIIFITISFIGTIGVSELLIMMAGQYIFKVCYETAFTPFTYLITNKIKKIENIDTFDYNVKYNFLRRDKNEG